MRSRRLERAAQAAGGVQLAEEATGHGSQQARAAEATPRRQRSRKCGIESLAVESYRAPVKDELRALSLDKGATHRCLGTSQLRLHMSHACHTGVSSRGPLA